jgi:tetratricopeptide (TPR) repeat protein
VPGGGERIEKMAEIAGLRSEARRLARAGEWGPGAIEVNTRVLDLAPDDVAALTRRRRCFYEVGEHESARDDYERALALDSVNTVARNFLRKIKKEAFGREMWETEDTQRQRARVAAKSRRKNAQYESRRRRMLMQAEVAKRCKETKEASKAEALTSFEEALALGVTAKEERNYPLAIAAFRQAFRLDRRRRDVILRLATTHRANKEPEEARRLYEWVLEREESPAALVGLAAVHRDQRQPLEACALYKKALFRRPDDRHALAGLAGALSDLGLREHAARTFRKIEAANDP